jgi:Zinc dependent phospholipase C
VSHSPVSTRAGAPVRLAAGLLAGALFLLASAPATEAWSFEVHRFIADRAIDRMPEPLRPFFRKYRTQVVEHAIDPDLWRNAGFEEEPPRHFLDMDAFGAYPFDALPHDYDQAVAKFGRDMVRKNGLLPWRTEEIYKKLVEAFANQKQGRGYALENIKFFTSVVAHYVSDAHVPFHAIANYDGQQTGQQGIHARFETELFERYGGRLTIHPPGVDVGKGPRDFIFATLTESAKLADGVLVADREAIGSGDVYDRGYFDRFYGKTRPILERRISESIGAVVAIVTRAWDEGGRPDLPLVSPRRDQRKRQTPQTPPPPTPPAKP